jgi:serine/threonine protein kinase
MMAHDDRSFSHGEPRPAREPSRQDASAAVVVPASGAGASDSIFDRETRPLDPAPPFAPVVHRLLPPAHRFPQVGSLVKHYQLLRQLGEGAMGTVYLARDTKLDRLVAIKVLRFHSEASTERFLIEAEDTARCKHDNVVGIHEVDELHGHPYMVLEYLQGRTLREWMTQRDRFASGAPATEQGIERDASSDARDPVDPVCPVSPSVAIELMLPVVRALTCVHDRGLVHCDLKPENVFVTNAGRVVVLDFGIARRLETTEPPAFDPAAPAPAVRSLPTMPGAKLAQRETLFGTLPYMSPEQLRSEEVDARSDLWSVGIMLYELVTGTHPLSHHSIFELFQIGDADEPMPSVRDRRADAGALGAVIDRCLRKHRDERHHCAEELLAVLGRHAHRRCSEHPRPASRAARRGPRL